MLVLLLQPCSMVCLVQRSKLNGLLLIAFPSGLQFAMFCQSAYFLLRGPQHDRKSNYFYIAYGAVILILITFATSANAVFGQLMWIEHRDYPGGPANYFMENAAIWVETLGSAADVTGNVMGDALLVSAHLTSLSNVQSLISLGQYLFCSCTVAT